MDKSPETIQNRFNRIAQRYDFMNRIMTFGMDRIWRSRAVRMGRLKPEDSILDVATGTGDIPAEILQQVPDVKITGIDFSASMLACAAKRIHSTSVIFRQADALNLPFETGCFDAVFSAFFIRNAQNTGRALEEQYRVLKPGGKLICLETRPPGCFMRPLVGFYLRFFLPFAAGIFTGFSPDYRYLADSTFDFLEPDEFTEELKTAGFKKISYRKYPVSPIVIYKAGKAEVL